MCICRHLCKGNTQRMNVVRPNARRSTCTAQLSGVVSKLNSTVKSLAGKHAACPKGALTRCPPVSRVGLVTGARRCTCTAQLSVGGCRQQLTIPVTISTQAPVPLTCSRRALFPLVAVP
jgi:hypothetical protein